MTSSKKTGLVSTLICLYLVNYWPICTEAHEAKDFDDSILYRIDFERTNELINDPDHKRLKTFYTHEKEKYECLLPVIADAKEEVVENSFELAPYVLLARLGNTQSCSYRIEAYWSYEICHSRHVRQYHEEREGKNVKFQEYYLGLWSEDQHLQMIKNWEESRKSGLNYKTIKIDNVRYPYFEVEMNRGTMCNIINAPRTTIIKYVCYPHGKNEIYSFKETSSCNYEAIILNPTLCILPAFYPEESKEVSINCYNPHVGPLDPQKPLSMLRQELSDMQMSDDDFPVSKEANEAAGALARSSEINARFKQLDEFGGDVDKFVKEMLGATVDVDAEISAQSVPEEVITKAVNVPISDTLPIREFISGKSCLTGGTGWWKYEFCYGRHVRQFHKDKKSEAELFLGYFSESAHRQWLSNNPDKATKHRSLSGSLWHHYEKGTHCDRTNVAREVDVKLTCTPATNSAVSMYLLEPKTCQYILVVESPIVCELMQIVDEHGLVQEDKLQQMLQNREETPVNAMNNHKAQPTTRKVDESSTGTNTGTNANSVRSEVLPQENIRA